MSENAKWYVIHTYSGYENAVKAAIEKSVVNRGMSDMVLKMEIPMETVTEVTESGVMKEVERKVFPGYVLLKMVLTDDTWHLIRNIRGVTGFVGEANKAIPLTDEEVRQMSLEKHEIVVKYNVGETVKIAYVDQTHKDIDPAKTVYQVVSGGLETFRMGGRDMNARAYLSRFNFTGADQEKLIGVLSGGERNRLHLAMALKEEGNVLLLDEPTNDIDVNTLRALEEGLENFAGCAVVISHDRWFLDRICTHILAFEGDSKVFYFEGSYSEYEENKKKRLGDVEPHRVRYRKLME